MSEPIPVTVGLKLDTPETDVGCHRVFSDSIDKFYEGQAQLAEMVGEPLALGSSEQLRSYLEKDEWVNQSISPEDGK